MVTVPDVRPAGIDAHQQVRLVRPDCPYDPFPELVGIVERLVGKPEELNTGKAVDASGFQCFFLAEFGQFRRYYRPVARSFVAICAHDKGDFLALGTPFGDRPARRRLGVIRVRRDDHYRFRFGHVSSSVFCNPRGQDRLTGLFIAANERPPEGRSHSRHRHDCLYAAKIIAPRNTGW